MRRLSAATAGVLLLLAAGPVSAACSVTGQVKLGELPIADDDALALGLLTTMAVERALLRSVAATTRT